MTIPPKVVSAARGGVFAVASWVLAILLGMRSIVNAIDALPLLAFVLSGIALGMLGRERVLFRILAVLVTCVLIAGVTPIVPMIGRQLMRADADQPVSAVVVLGADMTGDGRVGEVSVSRMLSGFGHTGAADSTPMVFSIVRRSPLDTLSTERDIRQLVALVGGRPVLLLRDVFTTHDEALEVRLLAKRHGWARVAVVTSPAHSGRACRTFETAGLQVACWPSDERGARVARANSILERILATSSVVYELLAWTTYRMRGWV